MELRYYAADFVTGVIYPRELHIEDLSIAKNEQVAGPMSCVVNLEAATAESADPLSEAAQILAMITPGACSIVPIREGGTNGTTGPIVDTVMGEWMITTMDRRHGSPRIPLRGGELGAYFAANVLASRHKGGDTLALGRELIAEALQGISYSMTGVTASGITTTERYEAGVRTYADVLQELQGDRAWSWRVDYQVTPPGADGLRRLQRTIIFDVALDVAPQSGIMMELVAPGETPASALDCTISDDLGSQCTEVWAFGGGAGSSQIREMVPVPHPAWMPRISRNFTASDIMTHARLRGEGVRVAAAQRRERQPWTVELDMNRTVLPAIGSVQAYRREPSLSMPSLDEFNVRVREWSWKQPKAGQIETLTATVERVI